MTVLGIGIGVGIGTLLLEQWCWCSADDSAVMEQSNVLVLWGIWTPGQQKPSSLVNSKLRWLGAASTWPLLATSPSISNFLWLRAQNEQRDSVCHSVAA